MNFMLLLLEQTIEMLLENLFLHSKSYKETLFYFYHKDGSSIVSYDITSYIISINNLSISYAAKSPKLEESI